ncbi:acyl carrier protein [Teredinibacter haidensis]|uniref:acyl carrier protein n=1 Tax=Teredinibacter haidensis TaxID=2731755 RepID=UPI000948BE8E|nr:acyl carrier protein [Teredinibacter haidensis]
MNSDNALDTFFSVVNNIKKTAFSADIIATDFHLGGDLGIDSREMLEIWYDLEEQLSLSIPDTNKRDIYTVQDVLDVLENKTELQTA